MNRFEKARRTFDAYMTQLGAAREVGQAARWLLQTPLGETRFSMHADDFSIYVRFEDVEKASRHLPDVRLNRHSGKWNWHGLSRNDNPLEAFKVEMDAIMAMKVDDTAAAPA
jgi:hypothetical protein